MKRKYAKRRRDKYNPYKIFEEDGVEYISFLDGNGCFHKCKINKELYDVFNEFELQDVSFLNKWDRHLEHSQIEENRLNERAIVKIKSVDEVVIEKLEYENLYKAISDLSDIQRRRVVLYFFEDMTYAQIACREKCSKVAVKYTIDKALRQLKLAV